MSESIDTVAGRARMRTASIPRGMLLLLVAMMWPEVSQAQVKWSPELIGVAESLTQQGRVRLTGDVACELGRGDGQHAPAFDGSDAQALLRVASQPRIYLFAHGFYPNARRTKPPMAYVESTWRGHLEIVRNLGKPYAACLFVSDTAEGFGDNRPAIGDFLFALRALTDDPDLYAAGRRLTLVGYSAGVNYIKQGVVAYRAHLQSNGIGPAGIKPTAMDVVFLGGVHVGTSTSLLAGTAVTLMNTIGRMGEIEPKTYEERFDQRWREFERSEMEALVGSRGMRQLVPGSQDLQRLNRAFLAGMTPNVEVLNVVSAADTIAPPESGSLPLVESTLVERLLHGDFVAATLGPAFRAAMRAVYAR